MRVFAVLFGVLFSFTATYGQTVKGKTKTVTMKFEPQYEFTLPPNLYVNMDFADANGNGLIEAEETATLTLNIINKGTGPAQGLKVKLTAQTYDPEFKIGDEVFIRRIEPGASKEVQLNLEAGFHVKTNEHKIQINVTEHFGFETLQLVAQSKPFKTLNTQTQYGYQFIKESTEAVMILPLGLPNSWGG